MKKKNIKDLWAPKLCTETTVFNPAVVFLKTSFDVQVRG